MTTESIPKIESDPILKIGRNYKFRVQQVTNWPMRGYERPVSSLGLLIVSLLLVILTSGLLLSPMEKIMTTLAVGESPVDSYPQDPASFRLNPAYTAVSTVIPTLLFLCINLLLFALVLGQ